MPFCNQCGQQLNVEDAFCDVCGTPVRQSSDNQDQQQAKNSVIPESAEPPLWVNDANSVENLSLWGYFLKCFKLYSNSNGRARRKEYWGFLLFCNLIIIGLELLSTILISDNDVNIFGIVSILFTLGIFIPHISVVIRRLHDLGKSGNNFLWLFFPLIGWIYIFLLLIRDGNQGINKYGNSPKGNNITIKND